MSDYQKEVTRRQKEENGRKSPVDDEGHTPEHDARLESNGKKARLGKVDYNALDYEDNENQSDEEETSKKKVPSLVQYPFPDNSQSKRDSQDDAMQGDNKQVGLVEK